MKESLIYVERATAQQQQQQQKKKKKKEKKRYDEWRSEETSRSTGLPPNSHQAKRLEKLLWFQST